MGMGPTSGVGRDTDRAEGSIKGTSVVPVRSVERAVDILLALGDGPNQLIDISRTTNLSKATAYRILTTLKHKGIVLQDEASGDYRLGPNCFRLMSSVVDGRAGFPFAAEAELRELRDLTGETITVHVRAGMSRICIEELPSPHPLRYVAGLGATAGIHVGSAGKVLLAFMPEDELEGVLAHLDLRPMTPNTLTDTEKLRQELVTVRKRGSAYSVGERVVGAVGVSAPVLDHRNVALAAISVLSPASRADDQRIREFDELVRKTAADISQTLPKGL